MAFLDCSDHWIIDIGEGIEIKRVIDGALKPSGNQGAILLAARADGAALVMQKNFPQHTASIELAPPGGGNSELLIRVAPSIALSSVDARIHLDAGTPEKNIVIYERVPVPGETIFVVTPVPPNNLDGTITPDQVVPFPLQPDAAARRAEFVDCSDQWRIEVDDGIELRKVKQSAFPNEKGNILSAKAIPLGSAANKRLALTADPTTHKAKISLTEYTDPDSHWLLRVTDGITISKDHAGDKGVRLTTDKPKEKDIVASLLITVNEEIAFVHSQVPKRLKGKIKEEDMEPI